MSVSNTLGYYNPFFYANEALIQLEKALGMAGRVHRGYDEERRSFRRGEYINIRKPSTFEAKDAPSTSQDIQTETTQIQLNNWREVKIELTDKELAFTQDQIIDEHIRPAAYALADDVDQKLAALYKRCPWVYDLTGTLAAPKTSDITSPRRIMFNNNVPVREVERMHYMVDGTLEENFLNLPAFTQYQGASADGVQTQMTATMGPKFGVNLFANQNVQSHTAGALTAGGTIQLNAAAAKGATTLVLKDSTGSLTGDLHEGDTLVIAGNSQRYAVTADATAATNLVTVNITPGLAVAYAEDDAVTVDQTTTEAENLMFHRNAIALATAPLSELGGQLGARIATITDPVTRLSLRSRLFYDGDNSTVKVALDMLYGFTFLDPNLACRGRRTS